MRRRPISLARKAGLGLLAAQGAIVVGLTAGDAWRKRIRPHRARFPHTPVAELPVGDSVTAVYTYGVDLYADMLAAIEGAEHRVLFASFIVKHDEVGDRFKAALIAAADRGVEVFVIYDGFANLVVRRSFFDFPPNVCVYRYPAVKPGMLWQPIRRSGRDHRKLLVVDGHTGFVGGYNVGAAYATEWRDTHLRISGPSAWELENAFVDFWNNHAHGPHLAEVGTTQWEPHLRVHRNVPAQLTYPIRGLYLEAIDRATRHVLITQPYFIPDREIVRALLAAARRGVHVELLMPERSNHIVADWLSRGFYTALLDGGVELWLYQDAMVHAKTATIDGRWSTIGTANIDRVSLIGNYEVNVEIFDAPFAEHLEAVFQNDLTNARRLTREEWRARPIAAKFSETVLAPLRPLL